MGNDISSSMSSMESKLNYLFFISCAIAPLSMVGSSLTLRAIYHHDGPLTTYQRLLGGLSCCDWIMSLALAFGPLPMPSELQEYGVPGAHGTQQTCTAQGFLLHIGCGSFVYSAMLLFYFVLVIRYNVTSRFLVRRVEPVMHVLGVGFFGATAVVGLVWQIFNPSGVQCWVGAMPLGCEDDDAGIECTRGPNVKIFGQWMLVYPYIFWVSFTIVCTMVIALTVYTQYRTRFAHVFKPTSTGTTTTTPLPERSSSMYRMISFRTTPSSSVLNANNNNTTPSRGQEKLLKQAVIQSMLYGLWFLNFSIWALLSFCFHLAGTEMDSLGNHFWLTAIQLTLFPSQGIFNFVIYIRPTYLNIRRTFPTAGRWFAVKEAVWHPFASAQERNQHYSKHSSSHNQHHNSSSQQQRPVQDDPSSTLPWRSAEQVPQEQHCPVPGATTHDDNINQNNTTTIIATNHPCPVASALVLIEEEEPRAAPGDGLRLDASSSNHNASQQQKEKRRQEKESDNQQDEDGIETIA
ncbi:expressed unknown protein [Seminavis robusta]|uniref:G-protein coupled receptors family 2 profile 2 domain-containing protein n=1 Tax=Seminavis robusta TaxID=568900 RepID=A0A9N8E5N3_9STRA|nr:expressed unknown protein [Seminavis robusta]|eukprot:Sro697_g189110.1 n/a (518) ;mRNA; f:43242-44795